MPNSILIADDDADVRHLLDTKLRAAGYDTILAADGQSAIDQAKAAKPTLLILNPALPQHSGFEVLKALKTAGGSTQQPVIFLSTHHSSDDIAAAIAAGAADFISKPFSPRVVLERIQVTLIRYGLWQTQEQG